MVDKVHLSLVDQSNEQRAHMDEQGTQVNAMLNTSYDSLEGSLLQKGNGPVTHRPAFSCSSMKHALKQQARRRRRNTAIASGNSPPITRVSMKAADTSAVISPQGFIINDLSSHEQTSRKGSRVSEFKMEEGINASAEDAKCPYSGMGNYPDKAKCSKIEMKHKQDVTTSIVKLSTVPQNSVRSSIRLANSYAQSPSATSLPVASTSTAFCSFSSNGSSTTVTQANKCLRVCPPQSSPSNRDSQSFSMTLMQTYLAGVPGFKQRKRSQRKLSTSAQLAQTKEGSIDLESPDSILVGLNVKSLINKYILGLLPTDYQSKLVQLLPPVDIADAIDNSSQLTSNWLNNEFLARACESWRVRLGEGEFTHENQLKLKAESEKEKSKIDPWKVIHFEPVWGMKQQPGEPSKGERKPNIAVELRSHIEPLHTENSHSKFTEIQLEKLSQIIEVISQKIETKFKTEVINDSTLPEIQLPENCPNCLHSQNSTLSDEFVCNCSYTTQSQQRYDKRKSESIEIEAKRFCNNNIPVSSVYLTSNSEVSSSCLSPMTEKPLNITVSDMSSILSDSPAATVSTLVSQPLVNKQVPPDESNPTVEVQKSSEVSVEKLGSPQTSCYVSHVDIPISLPSVSLRKAPKVVSQLPNNLNTVTLRVGQPVRSGGVNIQRSYEIVQGVIANSPNREQLKAQLKCPTELLAQNISRCPSKTSVENVSYQQPTIQVSGAIHKQGIKRIGCVEQAQHNKQTARTPHIIQSSQPISDSFPHDALSLNSTTKVYRNVTEVLPFKTQPTGVDINSVPINPVDTNKLSSSEGTHSSSNILLKSNQSNTVSMSKLTKDEGTNIYKYGRPLLVAVSGVDQHSPSQVITVSGNQGGMKILLNSSQANVSQTNVVQSPVNQGSPITWHPPSQITILRKSSDKPGYVKTVSVSNLQFVRIPSRTDKLEAPRASSVPPVATSLTSLSPRPNSVGPRILIPTSKPTIVNIGHIPHNSYLYEVNPNPSVGSQHISRVPENVQSYTLDGIQTGNSDEESASEGSDLRDGSLAAPEIEDVDSTDEVLNKTISEIQSPSSDNEKLQESYVYGNRENFLETPSKEYENTAEAYSDESSFSRTANYIFTAHPGSDSICQEDIEQHSTELYDNTEKSECENSYHEINSEETQYSTEEQLHDNADASMTGGNQSDYCDAQYENEQQPETMLGNSYYYEGMPGCDQQYFPKTAVQYNAAPAHAVQQEQLIRAYSRAAYKVDGRPVHNFSGNAVQVSKKTAIDSVQEYSNSNHIQPVYHRQVTAPNMTTFSDTNANQSRNVMNNNQIFNSPQMIHKLNNSNSFCSNSLSIGCASVKGSFGTQQSKRSDSSTSDGSCPCNMQAMVMCLKCGAFCHHDCISSTRLCVTCFIR